MAYVIVVADDEELILHLVTVVLEDEGYRVLQAANGVAALALLEAEPADLLITDNMMPLLGGRELLARLDARPGPLLPAILMSAVMPVPPLASPVAFLAKPFDLDRLLALVRTMLGD